MKKRNSGKKILSAALAAAMVLTPIAPTSLNVQAAVGISDEVLVNAQSVAKQIEAEGIVLLKNEDQALPLTGEKKVNIFGSGQIDPFYGGGGSGSVQDTYAIKFLDALKTEGIAYNETLAQTYADWYAVNGSDGSSEGSGGAAGQLTIDQARAEMDGGDLTDEMMSQAKGYADEAIIVISRSGSESADLDEETLRLLPDEESMVERVCGTFSKVTVLFNICNVLEMDWLDKYPSIKAAAIIWAPGEYGMQSVAEMLSGKVNPSGRLADTIAVNVQDHPSTVNFGNFPYTTDGSTPEWGMTTNVWGQETEGWVNGNGYYHVDYEEGIYVGYRYFETFGVEVQYPFGYGLSYTDFSWQSANFVESDGVISVDVEVMNTGDVAGKDVVEVYYEAPYTEGGIEKSSCVLGGFAKTQMLEPGDSETVTVTFDEEDMASYSMEKGCYVLDEGVYKIKVAKNAHDAGAVFTHEVAETKEFITDDVTGNQIENLFEDADDNGLTVMSRVNAESTYPTTPDTYTEELLKDIDSVDKVKSNPGAVESPTVGAVYDEVITLKDVSENASLWDVFLDQLTVDEMIEMIANSGFRTGGVERLGIPVTQDNDGPASVKGAGAGNYTDTGIAYPVETTLACTWNVDLAEQMGVAAGKEAADIGTNVWYAPACNTHRSPMGGRNFEYYSEDPLLAGKMTAAVTRGAQSEQLIVTVKHFALNDQETNRDSNGLLTWADEQTMREIYLKPFEIAVKEGNAMGIMSSFNRLGTQWAGGSKALLTDLLRNEWGFKGFVVTDYYLNFSGSGYMSPVLAVYAQNDAFLTGMWGYQSEVITNAMKAAYEEDPVGFGMAMRNCVKNLCTMKMMTKAFTEMETLELADVAHTTVTEGFDWGPAITKIILNVGKDMDGSMEISKDAFTVYVERKNPETGEILTSFDFTTLASTESKGNRTVEAVYVSDKEGNKASSGQYLTIEMMVGPNETLGSPFNYDFNAGLNSYVNSEYTITQKQALTAADGSEVAVKSTPEKLEGNSTLLCDTFDLTGTFEYKDSTYGDISLCYASYTPSTDAGKNPLIIWLHGAGEGGSDPSINLIGNKVVNLATDEIQNIFGGAYILAPQSDTMWMNDGTGEYTSDGTSKYTTALMELIKKYVSENSDIDANRIYIGGCSNGGYMTMNMITTYPSYFAAAYPVCEAFDNEWLTEEKLNAIKDLPIWFTHAYNDPTVAISERTTEGYSSTFTKDENGNFILNGNFSPKAYERLAAAGNKNVHISLFDDVHDTTGNYFTADGQPYQYNGHWSWIYTLNNECKETIDGKEVTIMEWLASQTKEELTPTPIEKISISTAKVGSISKKTHTGKAIRPAVDVTVNGITLKAGTDYKVSYAKNRKIGKATITITGIGSYTGTKTTTFKIVPKRVKSFTVKAAGTKSVSISWKKDSKVTGYQIYVKRPGSKTWEVAKKVRTYKRNKIVLRNLKMSKTYRYKIRAYKKVDGINYYGAFTKVNKIKVV